MVGHHVGRPHRTDQCEPGDKGEGMKDFIMQNPVVAFWTLVVILLFLDNAVCNICKALSKGKR